MKKMFLMAIVVAAGLAQDNYNIKDGSTAAYDGMTYNLSDIYMEVCGMDMRCSDELEQCFKECQQNPEGNQRQNCIEKCKNSFATIEYHAKPKE